MTQPQVAVRLAVVGGTQFKAEMNEAGRVGAQSIDRVTSSSQRMSPALQSSAAQMSQLAVSTAAGGGAMGSFAGQIAMFAARLGPAGIATAVLLAGVLKLASATSAGRDSAAEMAEKMGKLEGSVGGVQGAVSALEGVQRLYNDAISKQGGASSAAASAVIANSRAEFTARKEILAIELELLRIRGKERAGDLQNLQDAFKREANSALAGERDGLSDRRTGSRQFIGEFSSNNPNGRSRLRGDPQQAREFDDFLKRNEKAVLQIRKLNAEQQLANQTIKRTSELLNKDFADISANPLDPKKKSGSGASKVDKSLETARKLFEETRTAAERYKIALDDLDAVYASGAITTEVYQRKQEQLRAQFESAGQYAAQVAGTVKSAMTNLFDGIFEGGGRAGDAIDNLAKRLAAMALQESTFKLLAGLLPGTFGKGGFVPLASANGNVFTNGTLTPFAAGGVVSGPTIFPMRGGTGLMGEAGPEAIMPLTRIGGKLGVAARGGGGGTLVQIIDQRSGGAQIETQKSTGPDGREVVRVIVGEELARGTFSGQLQARHGLGTQKVRR